MKRICALLLVLVLAVSLCSCGKKEVPPAEEDMRMICELATLDCYYNNVAVYTKPGNFLQKDREMWIEYQGAATIGIDMSKVTIKVSGEKVKVTLPAAEVMDVRIEADTMEYTASSDGTLFTNKITTEEQQEAVEKAQAEMEKSVKENTSLFVRAEERAKELITHYIEELGECNGVEYTIEWKAA